MTELSDIISEFSNENKQKFILYLEKKNKRSDTKNIQLFNLLFKSELNSDAICKTLYGSKNQNAYYALRKRLHESLIDFTANQSLLEENSVNMQIIKYILASKAFLQQKQYKVAYNILNKAEKLAIEHELFPFLNEIYQTQIQYAHTYPAISIDLLIVKLQNNQTNIQLESKLNIIYANIRKTINNINYKGEALDFQTILTKTLKTQNIDLKNSISFKVLYQLVTIASISAFITKDYLNIEQFLVNIYNSYLKNKNNSKQHYYHIQILYNIANALFRNKKFIESLNYLELMHQRMLLNKKKLHNTFKLKYILLSALNHNYNNQQDRAIELLEPTLTIKHPDTESLLDIKLCLIVFYFQKNDLKKAQYILSKFYHSDAWYTEKAGKEWVIKKNLIEILLHIELENINLVESKLLSFKRSFNGYLTSINQQRVITYLKFVELYYKNPNDVTSNSFKNKVEKAFNYQKTHKEDIFVISFYSYLKSKMNNVSLFETTLQLIKQAQSEIANT